MIDPTLCLLLGILVGACCAGLIAAHHAEDCFRQYLISFTDGVHCAAQGALKEDCPWPLLSRLGRAWTAGWTSWTTERRFLVDG